MLRRCLTPNPHSKSKYLSQLVNSQSIKLTNKHNEQKNRINYDSFIYVDRLTNNRVVLGEVKNMYNCTNEQLQQEQGEFEEESEQGSEQNQSADLQKIQKYNINIKSNCYNYGKQLRNTQTNNTNDRNGSNRRKLLDVSNSHTNLGITSKQIQTVQIIQPNVQQDKFRGRQKRRPNTSNIFTQSIIPKYTNLQLKGMPKDKDKEGSRDIKTSSSARIDKNGSKQEKSQESGFTINLYTPSIKNIGKNGHQSKKKFGFNQDNIIMNCDQEFSSNNISKTQFVSHTYFPSSKKSIRATNKSITTQKNLQINLSKAIGNLGIGTNSKRFNTHSQKHNHARGQGTTGQGKGHTHTVSAFKQKQYSQTKQMQQINDCFAIMKSTKLFQMQNLKNKIFNQNNSSNLTPINQVQNNDFENKQKPSPVKGKKSVNSKQNNDIDNMIKKKKKIREFIEQYLNNLCLNQFRKYMEYQNLHTNSTVMGKNNQNQPDTGKKSTTRPQTHKPRLINPAILNLHKTLPTKISKQNIQKIIQQLIYTTQNNHEKKKPRINISIDDIDFPQQQRLKQILFQRMFVKNKQFEYLITPDYEKLMYKQIHQNAEKNIGSSSVKKNNTGVENRQSCAQKDNGTKYKHRNLSKNGVPLKNHDQKIIQKPSINNNHYQNIEIREQAGSFNDFDQIQVKADIDSFKFKQLTKQNMIKIIKNSKLSEKQKQLYEEVFKLHSQANLKRPANQWHRKEQDKQIYSKTVDISNTDQVPNIKLIEQAQLHNISKQQQNIHKQAQKQKDKKLLIKTKQLLLSIQSGSIYDFLFLIIRWPNLLHYKDKLGNNLLHISAKNNRAQIYNILVKKLGVLKLRQKNNCGKNPIQVAQLFGSFDIQKLNQQYKNCIN